MIFLHLEPSLTTISKLSYLLGDRRVDDPPLLGFCGDSDTGATFVLVPIHVLVSARTGAGFSTRRRQASSPLFVL